MQLILFLTFEDEKVFHNVIYSSEATTLMNLLNHTINDLLQFFKTEYQLVFKDNHENKLLGHVMNVFQNLGMFGVSYYIRKSILPALLTKCRDLIQHNCLNINNSGDGLTLNILNRHTDRFLLQPSLTSQLPSSHISAKARCLLDLLKSLQKSNNQDNDQFQGGTEGEELRVIIFVERVVATEPLAELINLHLTCLARKRDKKHDKKDVELEGEGSEKPEDVRDLVTVDAEQRERETDGPAAVAVCGSGAMGDEVRERLLSKFRYKYII